MAGAMLALLVASATVLGLGQGLRRLVDDGFKSGDAATLDRAVLVLIGVIVLLALVQIAVSDRLHWRAELAEVVDG